MSLTAKRWLAVLATISAFLVLMSCSSGPTKPRPGTTAFFWEAAKENFAAGDYTKTLEQLDKVLAEDNEYTARALPWSLTLTAGMAAGYAELADAYQEGAKRNKANDMPFRRQMLKYRSVASRLALQFADKFAQFEKTGGDSVPLAFTYPKGAAAPVAQLVKVSAGTVPLATQVDAAERQGIERGVLMAVADAVGSPGNPGKAEQILSAPDAKVPRATFQFAMADTLYDMAQLFSREKLNDSEKLQILYQRAQAALKRVPESADSKELNDKIDHALKAKK